MTPSTTYPERHPGDPRKAFSGDADRVAESEEGDEGSYESEEQRADIALEGTVRRWSALLFEGFITLLDVLQMPTRASSAS